MYLFRLGVMKKKLMKDSPWMQNDQQVTRKKCYSKGTFIEWYARFIIANSFQVQMSNKKRKGVRTSWHEYISWWGVAVVGVSLRSECGGVEVWRETVGPSGCDVIIPRLLARSASKQGDYCTYLYILYIYLYIYL